MNTMIKTCKIRHLAAAFVVLAGLAGQAAYAGQSDATQEIQSQGKQALNTIRGEIAASIELPATSKVSLPKMTVYASQLDNMARRLRYEAVRGIRTELRVAIADDVATVLGTRHHVTFAAAIVRTSQSGDSTSTAR